MRAVSILMVVIAHSANPAVHPLMYEIFGHMGNYGVRIFFLISGFLITGLLLKESESSGSISLKNFYMRRIIRIFPAFYVYVGTICILSYYGISFLLDGDLLHTLTYTMNYREMRGWALNHTWSLSVEEQFYLLWPAVMVFAGIRRAVRSTMFVIILVPLIRLFMYVVLHSSASALGRHFEATCDSLATGCLLAGMYNRLGTSSFYRKLQSTPGYLLVPLFLIAASGLSYKIGQPIYYVIGQTVGNIGGALLLDYVVRNPRSYSGLLLNTKPFMLIGLWSYSIYLWQELLLDEDPTGLYLQFPWNYLALLAVSVASYYLVEKQFLRLRKWFEPGRKPAAV
jgi:peptidoglycan/LPS O-acetylase OafA/YrhL